MKPGIPRESAFCAGVCGASVDDRGAAYETRQDIDRAAIAKGLTPPSDHQLERWRGAGLLPDVRREFPGGGGGGGGSVTLYPAGTAQQAVRILELLAIKEKLSFVGWELWWEGYPVGEDHWKPILEKAAQISNAGVRLVARLMARWIRADEGSQTTFDKIQDQVRGEARPPQFSRRLNGGERASFWRIVASLASKHPAKLDEGLPPVEGTDWEIAVRGLDLETSGNYPLVLDDDDLPKPDVAFGMNMNFIQVLPEVFAALATVIRTRTLSEALRFPLDEVLSARDDVRNALQIASDTHEGVRWIYGNSALGLRVAAWMSTRASPTLRAQMTLGFALLRRTRYGLLPSQTIADLAQQAGAIKRDFLALRAAAEKDARLRPLLSPKTLREALADRAELNAFMSRVRQARQVGDDNTRGT